MAITDLPMFSMLRTQMQWHQERQRVLAENVANADTPNFRPRDLAPLKFDRNGIQSAADADAGDDAHQRRPYRIGERRQRELRAARNAAATRCGPPATPSTSKTR